MVGLPGGLPPGLVRSVERVPGRPSEALERAERSGARKSLGATKEVLGLTIDFLAFN